MLKLFQKAWGLLTPFHRSYWRFLIGIAARQGLIVAGGYSLVWLLHVSLGQRSIPIWVFILGLLVYDLGLVRFDLTLNKSFVSRVTFPMFAFLRSKALQKVFEMPQAWHHRHHSGKLTGKVNDGIGKVVQTAESFGRELCPAIIQTGLTLVPLVYFSPWTVLFVIAAVIAFAVITIAESRERRSLRKARYENYSRDFGLFSECVEYVQPVVHFGQTRRLLRQYSELQDEIASQGVKEISIGNRHAWRRSILLSIAKRGCQGLWIWQFRTGALDAAMVMYLNALIEGLFQSFAGYAGMLERLHDGVEPARTLVNLFEEKPSMESDIAPWPIQVPESIGIEMQNVVFSYDNGTPVLRNFNLAIEPGTVLGLVGRSGIGKTTIQQLLSRVYDVQHGRILIAGRDIREWPLHQLRGIFSTVSQNCGVFFTDVSIFDTIRFARPHATRRQVIAVAKRACIHDEIMMMPERYETKVGQRGVTLSKGQQQRIAIAQALLALNEDRKILILDEFTSALDSNTEHSVLTNLVPLLKDRTVIIIAHRLATLRKIAHKIIVIDETGIVEAGDHAELLRQGGSYAEMAELQTTA